MVYRELVGAPDTLSFGDCFQKIICNYLFEADLGGFFLSTEVTEKRSLARIGTGCPCSLWK